MGKRSAILNLVVVMLTIIVGLFWTIASTTNVYESKIAGAIFELAALAMLLLGIALPIMAIYLVIKNTGSSKIWPILALAISFITILFISK